MLPSRGMGKINPAKSPRKIMRKDACIPVKEYCGGGMAKNETKRKR